MIIVCSLHKQRINQVSQHPTVTNCWNRRSVSTITVYDVALTEYLEANVTTWSPFLGKSLKPCDQLFYQEYIDLTVLLVQFFDCAIIPVSSACSAARVYHKGVLVIQVFDDPNVFFVYLLSGCTAGFVLDTCPEVNWRNRFRYFINFSISRLDRR